VSTWQAAHVLREELGSGRTDELLVGRMRVTGAEIKLDTERKVKQKQYYMPH
jgi:hypothetical protein